MEHHTQSQNGANVSSDIDEIDGIFFAPYNQSYSPVDHSVSSGNDLDLGLPPDTLASPPTGPPTGTNGYAAGFADVMFLASTGVQWTHHNTYSYDVAAAPEQWSNGSSVPTPSTTAQLHTCNICVDPCGFKEKKDLRRHQDSKHPTGYEDCFFCRCGKKVIRKDNYRRHVDSCKKPPSNDYTCKCHFACTNKREHVQHLAGCRYAYGRSGRPKSKS
ncbi:hypothetical protein F4680DRAFT_305154 [Xylaria scruposa]|nr:hypothetical protein F4680DRAFT_305154 [Xylaria scruposa]